ncbi:Homocysteine S-methyltransferase [Xylaria sp. FL1777]|nr:Homocysteine S-methyltransferase [Xylaria sp. FL1777]
MAETPVQFLDGGLGTSLEDKYKVSVEGFRRTRTDLFPLGVPRADIPRFLEVAVSTVEQVKQPTTKIALSLGPYGAVMTPSQEYTAHYDDEHNSADKLFRWHADRMSLFASIPRLGSRVDFVAFETVPRLDEILAIRQLTTLPASHSADSAVLGPLARTPYWISCVFPGSARALPDGSSISQVIRALLSLEHSDNPPWGIGINCTKIAELPKLVREYEIGVRLLEEDNHLRSWPSLLLYPDGTNGEVYDTAAKTWKMPIGLTETIQESSWEQQLERVVTEARTRGCWRSIVVGGCCKATHMDISRLRAQVLHF